MRDVAVLVPWGGVLELLAEVVEQELRRARLLDLLVDRLAVLRHEVTGEQRFLPVDHHASADFEDVGGLADEAREWLDRVLAPPGLDHDLDTSAMTGLEPAR